MLSVALASHKGAISMRLREIVIQNFRCLSDVRFPVSDRVILVGENNAGKTGILDALKLALPRYQPRGNIFDEYDYHMSQIGDSPETSNGIVIELWFREDSNGEWPNTLIQALDPIIQNEPTKDINSIGLRLSGTFDVGTQELVSKWEFLNLQGSPLTGKGADQNYVGKFLTYIRLFYLSALRDSEDEFSPRSQFWGRILRDLKIAPTNKSALQEELERLNATLLAADARLDQVRAIIDRLRDILGLASNPAIAIQPLPLHPWELMSKAQLVIAPRGNQLGFPLNRHGQGMQSLAVIFLFQAYIEVLLKPAFRPETEAIVTLEEPEAHLHPQATRALAASIGALTTQKIVSSHSPYFVQEVPFTDIRMLRRVGPHSKVLYVKRAFTVALPSTDGLMAFCRKNPTKFEYHSGEKLLYIRGKLEKEEYRDLLTVYTSQSALHPVINQVRDESLLYLSDAEIADLDTYAKRIRGEVLFARAWLLCEGQCEYLLLRFFAELLGYPLDQYGVTVIDFQNNGAPGTFVALGRVFEIPWMMVCDDDAEGKKFVKQVETRGVTGGELNDRVRPLPVVGADLELYLCKNGFEVEYKQILMNKGVTITTNSGDPGYFEEISKEIKRDKTESMRLLIHKLREGGANATRVPSFLRTLIEDLLKKAAA